MKERNKQLKQDYQDNPRPMGVFLIRNNLTDKIFLGAGMDIAGIINRHRFALKHGSHQNKALQADWNELGEGNFAFEILDELTPRAGEALDHRAELAVMEKLWLEKLQPFGERGYNEPQITRAERLKRIAAKRLAEPD